MEAIYTLKGLDCPHCSAKIEHDVSKLAGVTHSVVNLMQQTLTVKAERDDADALYEDISKIVHKHEPDVKVMLHTDAHTHHHAHKHEHGHCCGHDHEHEHDHCCDHDHAHAHGHEHSHSHGDDDGKTMLYRLIIGGILFAAGFAFSMTALPKPVSIVLLIAAYAVLGWDVVFHALKNISRGRIFDEYFLMSISTLGAFALGEFPEAAAVMLFYQIGEYFQSAAVNRSRKSVSALLDIRPDTANVVRDGETLTVHPETVAVGETVLVKAGERIPLDGVVLSGESALDTAALTGESVPRDVKPGDAVLSACVNQSGALTIRVTKSYSQSTAARIIETVEHAAARKAPAENFITTFARYYTPVVVILAVLLAAIPPLAGMGSFSEWVRRAFVFLIVSCPCALVISVPLTFFGGIGAASRHGVLVKGSNDLEALSHVRQIAFDKTGTLTMGVFHVQTLLPAAGCTEDELLAAAAVCEQHSNHPAAKCILAAYHGEIPHAETEELAGFGIRAESDGAVLLAGNGRLMERFGITYQHCDDAGTKVYLARNGKFMGCIVCADTVRSDSKQAIAALRDAGIRKMVMLTGDGERIAKTVADTLKLDGCYAELLPEDKVQTLEKLSAETADGEKLAFVGDGINDAPVLARADVGIAMGALGADAAIEAADVVLMTDEPVKIAEAVQLARQTKQIVMQNIVFAIGVKVLLLILGACGIAGMWAAVFGDVGVTVIAVLNAMRMLRK